LGFGFLVLGSHTIVDGLADFAGYLGEFGFAGSGEEVAACCAEDEAVEGHAVVGCRRVGGVVSSVS
jgi:hypothetical protein